MLASQSIGRPKVIYKKGKSFDYVKRHKSIYTIQAMMCCKSSPLLLPKKKPLFEASRSTA